MGACKRFSQLILVRAICVHSTQEKNNFHIKLQRHHQNSSDTYNLNFISFTCYFGGTFQSKFPLTGQQSIILPVVVIDPHETVKHGTSTRSAGMAAEAGNCRHEWQQFFSRDLGGQGPDNAQRHQLCVFIPAWNHTRHLCLVVVVTFPFWTGRGYLVYKTVH